MKLLFAGESWLIQTTHVKGYDVLSNAKHDSSSAEALFEALSKGGIKLDYLQSHDAQYIFPSTMEEISKYDVVALSDIGSNTLYFHPDTQELAVRRPNRLALIEEYVKNGGGLVMIGGFMSFSGIENKARYGMTPLADVLPVEMLNYDDRVERPDGVTPDIVLKDHPVLNGVDTDWPYFLGYNKIKAKKEADEIAVFGKDTFMAGMDYYKGRSFAFASDCVTHWGSQDFMKWKSYEKLFQNIFKWTAKEI